MKRNSSDLDHIFHPRSIAVAGVSGGSFGVGSTLLAPLLRGGFRGPIYPLNPRGGEVWGLEIFRSLDEVPGPVDYVIVSIPAPLVPQFMENCVTKGVKAVSIFSAGFSETGKAEGAGLEAEIVDIARRGAVRVLGPNCWGIYNPREKLCFSHDFPIEAGHMAFVGQSGGNCGYAVRLGFARGLRFSKVVSYGNACDVNESDLLQYFGRDPETHVIGAYVEGVRDGRRFLKSLREAAAAKPVILIKGGARTAGAEAAASHTGALVGSEGIWDTVVRQAGVVSAETVEEMVDTALAFSSMAAPRGRNIAIVGGGGGVAVLSADACERAGLNVPPFPPAVRDELRRLLPPVGTILRNPIDTQWIITVSPENLARIIEMLDRWEGCDVVLAHFPLDIGPMLFHEVGSSALEALVDSVVQASKRCRKPVALSLHSVAYPQSWELLLRIEQRCIEAGIPFFRSVSAAATAISGAVGYYEAKASP